MNTGVSPCEACIVLYLRPCVVRAPVRTRPGMESPKADRPPGESKKSTRILESFITPSFRGSPGTELPANVLENAKVPTPGIMRFRHWTLTDGRTQGLIICTVLRGGFMASGRFGSGVIVARCADGSWSAPSAIGMVGCGFGGLVGVEITDFVFVLNDEYAVDTFSHNGSLSLSGNVSVAFGPLGRSAEFAGGASLKGAAAVFAYAKTKGIFGGVSVEGALFIEGRSASRKLYGDDVNANQLLKGAVVPPPEVRPLMDVLARDIFHPKAPKAIQPPELPREGTVELSAAAENQAASELDAESSPGRGGEGHQASHSAQDGSRG